MRVERLEDELAAAQAARSRAEAELASAAAAAEGRTAALAAARDAALKEGAELAARAEAAERANETLLRERQARSLTAALSVSCTGHLAGTLSVRTMRCMWSSFMCEVQEWSAAIPHTHLCQEVRMLLDTGTLFSLYAGDCDALGVIVRLGHGLCALQDRMSQHPTSPFCSQWPLPHR